MAYNVDHNNNTKQKQKQKQNKNKIKNKKQKQKPTKKKFCIIVIVIFNWNIYSHFPWIYGVFRVSETLQCTFLALNFKCQCCSVMLSLMLSEYCVIHLLG